MDSGIGPICLIFTMILVMAAWHGLVPDSKCVKVHDMIRTLKYTHDVPVFTCNVNGTDYKVWTDNRRLVICLPEEDEFFVDGNLARLATSYAISDNVDWYVCAADTINMNLIESDSLVNVVDDKYDRALDDILTVLPTTVHDLDQQAAQRAEATKQTQTKALSGCI